MRATSTSAWLPMVKTQANGSARRVKVKLQAMLPTSKVLEDTRFVDNGNIITTAGVSAGIDGALHLVARLNGMDAAKETARYMEYRGPQWQR
jgi:transcriptional regulator GlxA family with amidase domain